MPNGRWLALGAVGLAVAALTVASSLLRPGGVGTTAGTRAAAPTALVAAADHPTRRPATGPTLGPHGDAVSPVDGLQSWRDATDLPRRGQGRITPASRLAGYGWPLEHARITNGYGVGHPGSFELRGDTLHDGIDISSFCGARIVAAHAGVVLAAGRHSEGFLGWVGDLAPFRAKLDKQVGWNGQSITIVIDDGNGYRSVYAHLARKAVAPGDHVRAGDLIGWEGASGNATGCHLHYSLFDPTSPWTIELERSIVEETRLPRLATARIDPLLALPPLADADITWGWGARDGP